MAYLTIISYDMAALAGGGDSHLITRIDSKLYQLFGEEACCGSGAGMGMRSVEFFEIGLTKTQVEAKLAKAGLTEHFHVYVQRVAPRDPAKAYKMFQKATAKIKRGAKK